MGKVSDIRRESRPNIICLESHPNDSRVTIAKDGICQSLTGRMGTGGGNVPLVIFVKSRRAKSKDDFETWVESGISNTLNTFEGGIPEPLR